VELPSLSKGVAGRGSSRLSSESVGELILPVSKSGEQSESVVHSDIGENPKSTGNMSAFGSTISQLSVSNVSESSDGELELSKSLQGDWGVSSCN